MPVIDSSVFVAATAVIIGDVQIGVDSSIWFNVVIRGDVNQIRIGARTNIQDLTMLHVTGSRGAGDPGQALHIGNDVTVGHSVTLHGCTIEDGAFIGMRSMVMDRSIVGAGAVIAAGSLVPEGTVIPPGTLWIGSPAKFKRALSSAEVSRFARTAVTYSDLAKTYKNDTQVQIVSDTP
jgi:carbonic anhydrase/acetyltransferase-like protein (isoleucine patch superfamily)